MCVIWVALTERVPSQEIRDAWRVNKDGGGAAWRHNGNVRWRKGLELDKLVNMAATLPLPYVLHVRYATVGGNDRRLTHPFPLDSTASLGLRGETKRGVVFHNGHYGRWDDKGIPRDVAGPWSDSRMLVWVHEGIQNTEGMAQELANEGAGRFIVFTPDKIYKVGDFKDLCPGVLASNLNYQHSKHSAYTPGSGYDWRDQSKADREWWAEYVRGRAQEDQRLDLWDDPAPTTPTTPADGTQKCITSPRVLLPRSVDHLCEICHKIVSPGDRTVTRIDGHHNKTYEHVSCWQDKYRVRADHLAETKQDLPLLPEYQPEKSTNANSEVVGQASTQG